MEFLNQHLIKKSDLGFHGNLFGGRLLIWIDASAAAYAMQLCDTPRMVTVPHKHRHAEYIHIIQIHHTNASFT